MLWTSWKRKSSCDVKFLYKIHHLSSTVVCNPRIHIGVTSTTVYYITLTNRAHYAVLVLNILKTTKVLHLTIESWLTGGEAVNKKHVLLTKIFMREWGTVPIFGIEDL